MQLAAVQHGAGYMKVPCTAMGDASVTVQATLSNIGLDFLDSVTGKVGRCSFKPVETRVESACFHFPALENEM